MKKSAQETHSKAIQKTQQGDFLEALVLTDEATLIYQEEENIAGQAETQSARFIIFKHLYQKTHAPSYLILARLNAQAGVEIAKQTNNPTALAIPYFNLGKAYELEKKYHEAAQNYQQALELSTNHPSPQHNKVAIRADIKSHLAYAKYKSGNQGALKSMEEAIKELEETNDAPEFEKKVWLSGAHMQTAEMVYKENMAQAKIHLNKASEIIASDPQLILRKGQWEKLNKEINGI